MQHSSFDLPDASISRPQSVPSSGKAQRGRDAILCSRLKGHQAATTCALVTSDAGIVRSLCALERKSVAKAKRNLGGFLHLYD